MLTATYLNAAIDLSTGESDFWQKIDARTEVRMAQKSGITVELISDRSRFMEKAVDLLKKSLLRVSVPYSLVFDEILKNEKYYFFAAIKNGELASYIVISEQENSALDGKTAYLQLSATDDVYKKLCPNYLLIYEATKFLREKGFRYFNLGLLSYQDCPDSDLESVAFFKRKWATFEFKQTESVSALKYLYLRFLKRSSFIKRMVYLSNLIIARK